MSEEPAANPLQTALAAVARAARGKGLEEFLVIGGHAVIVYGVPRFTRDIDFLIPSDLSLRWRDLLEPLGYRFGHGTAAFEQFFPSNESALPRIDLMLVDRSTWGKLSAAAETHPFSEGLSLRVPAAKHMIALKLNAATSPTRQRASQDWDDVSELIRRCNLDIHEPELEALILRYGGEGAWSRLSNPIRPPSSPE